MERKSRAWEKFHYARMSKNIVQSRRLECLVRVKATLRWELRRAGSVLCFVPLLTPHPPRRQPDRLVLSLCVQVFLELHFDSTIERFLYRYAMRRVSGSTM